MGQLARDALRAVTLAAAAGLTAGAALGILAPSFAEAGPATTAAPARPVIVTSLDLLAGDRLEVTLRFTNTSRSAEHVDPAGIGVVADGAALAHRPDTRAATIDLRPGSSAMETVAFTAPTPTATLTLTLPGGDTLPLG
ncbi:hypothetical protein [Dactylosporangium sp. CA-092794]|uniref:hypothetical protein n=1 Tax=Dactylosporangium sp. CA-092794 TaxID=3239929 RepID=UPI003D8E7C56